jgi:hypothetical protein
MRLPVPADLSRARSLVRSEPLTLGVTAMFLSAAIYGCSDPERERLKSTTKPTYDTATGRLKELTFDANRNGRIDTWTEMDGDRALRSRIDSDEDGRVDRWEYYDEQRRLVKVGFSRKADGKPDAWAFSNTDGRIERIEVSSVADDSRIDRWEKYDVSAAPGADGMGPLLNVEEDTNGDGRQDKWERYENGTLATAEFDENGDGHPDRRLTYKAGTLLSVETEADGSGGYRRSREAR